MKQGWKENQKTLQNYIDWGTVIEETIYPISEMVKASAVFIVFGALLFLVTLL